MSIKVLELTKNSESVELSIDMQEGVGGAYNGSYIRTQAQQLYQSGLDAYAGGSADIDYRGGDIIEISNNWNSNALSLSGEYFKQNFVSATFSVKGDNVAVVNARNIISSP
jgi:hypothetical protein